MMIVPHINTVIGCTDTVVADYFACQKFCGLATKHDTQIFRGGKFSLITSAKKKFRS